jgi:hypothetical protein
MNRSLVLAALCVLCLGSARAQALRDQDLVTLKSGYQVLGYVIEQQPGKLIKVYRPDKNDTLDVPMTEVASLRKIWVQPFSEKEMDVQDTVLPGRFNNKKHVFNAGYVIHSRETERRERRGVSLSWYRNYNNRCLTGVSVLIFGRQDTRQQIAGHTESNYRHSLLQYHFLYSNQIRLGRQAQNRRVSTLLSIHTGRIWDRSESFYDKDTSPLAVRYEDYKGGWTFQTGLALRINPDGQSGFMIEPGYALFPQHVEQYTGEKGRAGSLFLGTRRQVNQMASLKLSYFF